MPITDTILLIILGGFVFYGLFYGLILTLGGLLSFVLGLIFASSYYELVFSWVDKVFFGYRNIGLFLMFLVLFTIVNRLVGLIFSVLDRTFDVISVIPFLKTINRIGGAALGFLLGVLAIGLALLAVKSFFAGWFERIAADSEIIAYLSQGANIILFFLPSLWRKIADWAISFVI